jgi:NAD(P)H-hydrate epimerase
MDFFTEKNIRKIERNSSANKGDSGRILVIGGSRAYAGAPALLGLGALRAGADWVTIVAPEKVGWAINSLSLDLVVQKLPSEYFDERSEDELLELSTHYDIVAIGNGMTGREDTNILILRLIQKIPQYKIIDADAIKIADIEYIRNSILTPHEKELEIFLINNEKNKKILEEKNLAAKAKKIQTELMELLKNNNVILLKGQTDIIISQNQIIFNKTGNSGMTVAGTGDVLAGITAGLLAQTKDMFYAASLAAYINGKCGDALLKKIGIGFLASDLLNEIPKILRPYRSIKWT